MEPNKALVKMQKLKMFQVTPKTSHLHDVKRIFRYLKGQPKLGLWYLRDSPFDLEAYSDSDYVGASLDRKSTMGANETVYKDWEDRMERATTTASSLETEQDSGNINWTQSVATLNEPLPQGTCSGSGPRSQVTIVGTTAKVKKVNDQEHIQALGDKQKVIIMEESIRRDLKFDDAKGMAKHKEIYVISSHTKKVFANMRRQGQGFFGNVTPLFENMMKKIKPKRKQRHAAKDHLPSSEIPVEESIPTPSNDLLPSGKDSIQLNELMIFYTNLQQQVLDLEEEKIAQAKETAKLKKRVKKLEKRRKSRPAGMRRLKKVVLSKQVESSEEKDSLGAQADASKQERSIEDIDQDVEIALVDEAQGRMHDACFELMTLTVMSVEDSATPTTATTTNVDDELTLVKTLITIKATKPKVISTAITTLRAKGIVIHKQVQEHIPTVSSSKAKGKANMIEAEKPLKKKDQITLDEEVARKLKAEMRAEMEEEERIAREKDKANRVVIEEWDDEQAKVADDDTVELKRCLEIVHKDDDDDVAIKATTLSSKSPTIVDYKIYIEEKKSYFKIIRADGNLQNYLTFGTMFKNFNKEDLEVLRSIVKEMFKKT
uniref:Uncharacterized mitochondrial protein AtMg00810-like n=1 Tax=Tanacetum cinerariifolium TaxID=118510 RepID=A0A6L2JY16_TANCI|nr:uncharacterized mitochondrial protein AtMg00810-like [Tanacetum cinerariifolium]